jgi:hypothetical protein
MIIWSCSFSVIAGRSDLGDHAAHEQLIGPSPSSSMRECLLAVPLWGCRGRNRSEPALLFCDIAPRRLCRPATSLGSNATHLLPPRTAASPPAAPSVSGVQLALPPRQRIGLRRPARPPVQPGKTAAIMLLPTIQSGSRGRFNAACDPAVRMTPGVDREIAAAAFAAAAAQQQRGSSTDPL